MTRAAAKTKPAAKTKRTAKTKPAPNKRPTPARKSSATVTRTPSSGASASRQIDAKIAALGDWRGALLARLRGVIRAADADVVEEVKWGGVPVWSHDGIICTGETYQRVVKLTFAKGAALKDPKRLFNSSLAGNTRRAIDFPEGAAVDEKALAALIRDAVVLNQATVKARTRRG